MSKRSHFDEEELLEEEPDMLDELDYPFFEEDWDDPKDYDGLDYDEFDWLYP